MQVVLPFGAYDPTDCILLHVSVMGKDAMWRFTVNPNKRITT